MDPVLAVSLPLSQWNLIANAIPELPMKIAQPLINAVGSQIQGQLDEAREKAQAEMQAKIDSGEATFTPAA